jgi:hypothetical protein
VRSIVAALSVLVLLALLWWANSAGAPAVVSIDPRKATAEDAPEDDLGAIDGALGREANEARQQDPSSDSSTEASTTTPSEGPLLWIRMVDAEDGAPVLGGRVAQGSRAALGLLEQDEEPLRSWTFPEPSGEADASGLASLHSGAFGDQALAWGAEHGLAIFQPVTAGPSPSEAFEVRLSRTARVEVEVLELGGGPLAGVGVTLSLLGDHLARPRGVFLNLPLIAWRTTTGDDGRAVLTGLPSGVPLHVRYEPPRTAPTRLPQTIELAPGETRRLTWTRGGGATLRGRLALEGGGPVADYRVWLLEAWTRSPGLFGIGYTPLRTTLSGPDGAFVFEDVPAGDWWVGPSPTAALDPPEGAVPLAPVAALVLIEPDTREETVDLLVPEAVAIEGTVIAAGSVAGVSLMARPSTRRGSLVVEAAEDGVFRLFPLAPGNHEVLAMPVGTGQLAAKREVVAPARGVELELGVAGSLVVRVVDSASGEPAPSSLAVAGRSSGHLSLTTSSGGTSTHEVEGLPQDRYSLLAQCTDGRAGILEDVSVEPGGEPKQVELAVHPAARLRVSHRGEAAYVMYRVLRNGRTVGMGVISAGEERVDFLPPGPYELAFEPAEGEPSSLAILAQLGSETTVQYPPE